MNDISPIPYRLRIVHLGKFYPPAPGGIETHVRTLAVAQAELGMDVRVVCVNHASHSGRDMTWAAYGATRTVRESDGGVEILRVGRNASVARLDVCPALPDVIRRLNGPEVDVIHLHTPNPTMLLAVAWLLRRSRPLVITHHSDVVKQRVLKLAFSPFENLVYRRADRLLASSDEYVEGSPLLQAHRHKVESLPLGLDLEYLVRPTAEAMRYADRMRERYPGPLWLAVGRSVYYKGLDVAIEALRHVPGHLIIVGTGPLEGQLREHAIRVGVAERITWLGYAASDELVGSYLAAAALWFPSNARSEAYGLVQVEAMAAGCPVINTRIPASGVAWVCPNEVAGLTVPINDARAFAAAANRLLTEPGLRDTLSAGAKARAASQFGSKLMADRSLATYRSILSGRPGRPSDRLAPQMTLSEWIRSVSHPPATSRALWSNGRG